MTNGIWVDAKLFDGFARFSIIDCVNRIRQQELCFALTRVFFSVN